MSAVSTPAPPADRARGRAPRATAALFFGALALHAGVALQYRHDPFATTLVADALSYHEWAARLAGQGLAAEPVFHQSPLFALVLAALYAVAPHARSAAALALQITLNSLAVAALVPLAVAYGRSRRAGLVAGCCALLHAPLVFHGLKLLPTPLALATQTLGLLALGRAAQLPSRLRCGTAGVLWGLACLTRSECLVFAPCGFLALAVGPRHGPAGAGWRRAAWYAMGLVLALAPATMHNLRQGDRVLIAASSGENLFIGNQRGATGGHHPLHPQAGDLFSQRLLAERLAEEAAGGELRPSEVSRYWTTRALHEIRADVPRWLRLELGKLARLLHPGDPTDIYSVALERRYYLTSLAALPLGTWSILLLGLAGAVRLGRERAWRVWPLVAWSGTQAAVLLLFFVDGRLRLPFVFSLLILAGVAIEAAWDAWRIRRTFTGLALVGTLALVGIVASLVATRATARDHVRLASVLSMAERLPEALEVLEPELARAAPDPMALDAAGWILQKQGAFDAARARYEQALAAGLPEVRAAQTLSRLGQTLERLGRPAEAARAHTAAVTSAQANAGSFYERGQFRLRAGDLRGAWADFAEAARRDPQWEAPRRALSRLPSGAP